MYIGQMRHSGVQSRGPSRDY